MSDLRPCLYVTDLSASAEALQSHVTTECVAISYTLINKPYPINCVHDEPLTQQGCRISDDELRQGGGILETRCEFFIQGLLESQTDTIINNRFEDADADTYKYETMNKILACWDKKKKDNHGNKCHY